MSHVLHVAEVKPVEHVAQEQAPALPVTLLAWLLQSTAEEHGRTPQVGYDAYRKEHEVGAGHPGLQSRQSTPSSQVPHVRLELTLSQILAAGTGAVTTTPLVRRHRMVKL